jgi:hypothetical protein
MASQVRFVGTGADDAGAGTLAWGDPGNITADDGAMAESVSDPGVTHYLKGTMAGNLFTVPAGATIDGVTLSVQRGNLGFDVVNDSVVKLVKAVGTDWGGVEAVVTYGGAADLWGVALTDADVNAANFGAVFASDNHGGDVASVDYMQITVHFTEAAVSGHTRRTLLGVG